MKAHNSKIKRRGIYIAIIIAMAVGIIFYIYTAVVFDVSRDSYVMANSVVGIAILVLELFLMITIGFGSYQDIRITGVFTMVTISAFLSTFFSLYTYEAYGLVEYSKSIRIMSQFSYITGAAYYGFLPMLIRSLDGRKGKPKVLERIIGIMLLVYTLVMLEDVFFGNIFKMEEGMIFYSELTNILAYVFWGMLYVLSFACIFRSELWKKEKRALAGSAIIPCVIAIIYAFEKNSSFIFKLNSIEDFALVLSLYFVFFNVYHERGHMLLVKEAELTQSRLNTTILQANPHFIYNTLGSIEYFCDKDPMQAKKLLGDFTTYLRSNSANLTNKPLISFREELENLKAFLRIEMVRFPNLLVEYEITSDNFFVPCLSIQPIVENAIKHGIGKRRGKAGTVTVKTRETPDFWQILIIDDGVGYTGIPQDGKTHIGIENVRERLAILCAGTLTLNGTEGKGTVAEIRIPKKRKENKHDSTLR